MSVLKPRVLWLAPLFAIVACGPMLDRRAATFDPEERFVAVDEEWTAPPLNGARLGLSSWLVCDSVPAQAIIARVRRNEGASVRLPQGHRLDIPRGSFAGEVREFVLVQPRTRHVAVFGHAQKVDVFERRVRLTIDYGARRCPVRDPGALRIVRIDEDGAHEVLPTTVGPGSTVYTDLSRLSTFAIAY